MIYNITIEYKVEAETSPQAMRKIMAGDIKVFKHIKSEVSNAIQQVNSKED